MTDRAWLTEIKTGKKFDLGPTFRSPGDGELSVTFDLGAAADEFAASWKQPGTLWERFGAVMAPLDKQHAVTLGEGNTPLVRSRRFAEKLGLRNLFFKLENCNPTGSFKDRQMASAISTGRSWGRTRYATVSSGNVGNALSAYCAALGYDAYVWVAADTAEGKRRQISVYGAQLFLFPPAGPGRMREQLKLFRGLGPFCAERGIVPMISARPVNPFMVEGTKTMSFEIAATLGQVPDEVFATVGGGGLIGGLHKGFKELVGMGQAKAMPRINGAQRNDRYFAPIEHTTEDKYVNGDYFLPLDGEWAWESIKDSNGTIASVDMPAITEAQAWLANLEGIFAEPTSAYGVAGLIEAGRAGRLDPDATIVCIVTGNGLKDLAAADKFAEFFPLHQPKTVEGLSDSGL